MISDVLSVWNKCYVTSNVNHFKSILYSTVFTPIQFATLQTHNPCLEVDILNKVNLLFYAGLMFGLEQSWLNDEWMKNGLKWKWIVRLFINVISKINVCWWLWLNVKVTRRISSSTGKKTTLSPWGNLQLHKQQLTTRY